MRPKSALGFRASCVALALFLGAIAHAAEQHPLLGANREQVLSRYGEPKSTLVAGNRELLFYPRERLTLRDGRVVDVAPIDSESTRRGAPPPAAESTPAVEPGVPSNDVAPGQPATTGGATTPEGPPPTEAAPAPAEPRLEIKRVLPPGTSSARTPAKKDSVPASGPATPTPPSSAATQSASAPTPPPSIATGGPVAAPSAAAPASPVPPVPSPVATTTPPSAGADAGANVPTEGTPTAPKAEEESAAAKKEREKKARGLREARRRLDEAAAEAMDPTAGMFTTRTYVIAFFVIFGGIGYLVWRSRQRQLVLEATAVSRTPFTAPISGGSGAVFSTEMLSKLEWKRFEMLVASYYSKTGVVASRTKNGPAAPVHIKISWKGEPRPFALVQCIAQPQGLIDARPLQALYEVLQAEDIRRGYVVTTGKFNVPARDFAEEKHITLLPGDIFLEKLNALPDAARSELMQEVATGDYTTPSCPICETRMVRSPEDPAMWRCAMHPDQQIPVRK